MLMVDPAAAIDQPRSTSSEGPRLKMVAKPKLNRPQISPAGFSRSGNWRAFDRDNAEIGIAARFT
jgi:hypothetical protein